MLDATTLTKSGFGRSAELGNQGRIVAAKAELEAVPLRCAVCLAGGRSLFHAADGREKQSQPLVAWLAVFR